ncbi:uncharacterized protein G6M90_00g079520 [Metarhizium brunneum]|uniref:Uncharacterized protein n=1 Tax=Metarhizium brunneum TaxID=500148 RepID=A0A7D5YV15_9HYPO
MVRFAAAVLAFAALSTAVSNGPGNAAAENLQRRQEDAAAPPAKVPSDGEVTKKIRKEIKDIMGSIDLILDGLDDDKEE